MTLRVTSAVNKLKAKGHRVTTQRMAILEAISKIAPTQPFSVETILQIIRKENPEESCDFTSVYRNLMTFEELQLVRRSDLIGDSTMYQIRDDLHIHNHFIVCKKCKKTEPIDACMVIGQETLMLKLGYKDISHRLEFYGICPKCAKKR
jgi:Fe2+ or Zn2+ uptake regulation protein